MAFIKLNGKYGHNKVAIVDEEDYGLLSSFDWSLSPKGMVCRRPRHNKKLGKIIYMHRLAMHKYNLDNKKRIYFKNGNKLDIRKINLRVVDMDLSRMLKSYSDFDREVCWPWIGTILTTGYGSFDGKLANKAVYEFIIGPVPKGLSLDHLCHTKDESCIGGDNCKHRSCVNPFHMEPVTPIVNTMRGRSPMANNARKKYCKNGHPFDLQNTLLRKEKGKIIRYCKICMRDRRKEAYEKNGGRLSRASIDRWLKGEVKHGTINAYTKDKCRCSECRAIARAYAKRRYHSKLRPDNRYKCIRLGESNNLSKLSTTQVIEIREKYKLGLSYSVLAKEYNISKSGIRNVITRRTWRHIN